LQANKCEQVTIGSGFTSDWITKEATQVFQPTPQDLSGKKLGKIIHFGENNDYIYFIVHEKNPNLQ